MSEQASEPPDEVGPDPLADDPTTPEPAPGTGHTEAQGRRRQEVNRALHDARDTAQDALTAPPAQAPRQEELAGPSRFLDQLRKQTPFWDLAERVARSSYPGATLDVRMAQLRKDRPHFLSFCLFADACVRAVIVIVLIALGTAAAVKTLWPVPWW